MVRGACCPQPLRKAKVIGALFSRSSVRGRNVPHVRVSKVLAFPKQATPSAPRASTAAFSRLVVLAGRTIRRRSRTSPSRCALALPLQARIDTAPQKVRMSSRSDLLDNPLRADACVAGCVRLRGSEMHHAPNGRVLRLNLTHVDAQENAHCVQYLAQLRVVKSRVPLTQRQRPRVEQAFCRVQNCFRLHLHRATQGRSGLGMSRDAASEACRGHNPSWTDNGTSSLSESQFANQAVPMSTGRHRRPTYAPAQRIAHRLRLTPPLRRGMTCAVDPLLRRATLPWRAPQNPTSHLLGGTVWPSTLMGSMRSRRHTRWPSGADAKNRIACRLSRALCLAISLMSAA